MCFKKTDVRDMIVHTLRLEGTLHFALFASLWTALKSVSDSLFFNYININHLVKEKKNILEVSSSADMMLYCQ